MLERSDGEIIYYPYLKSSLAKLPFAKDSDVDIEGLWDIRSSWYYGGPLFSQSTVDNDFFTIFIRQFYEHACTNGIVSEFIRFDANLRNYFPYNAQAKYNRETVNVHLDQTEEEIFKDYSSANRRAIRKAQRSGISIKVSGFEDLERWKRFHEIYDDEMYRKDAPKHLFFPFSFFLNIVEALGDRTVLITAERNGEMLGGFIIVFEWKFAFHFLSASKPESWPDRVNNILFHSAIMWSKKQACLLFDFMGGRPGVFRFKTNFSSTRGKFYTYKAIHMPKIYKALSHAFNQYFGIERSDPASFFPAYRVH